MHDVNLLSVFLCLQLQDLDGKLQVIEADTAEQQRKVQSLEAWGFVSFSFVFYIYGMFLFWDGIELLGDGIDLLIADGKD